MVEMESIIEITIFTLKIMVESGFILFEISPFKNKVIFQFLLLNLYVWSKIIPFYEARENVLPQRGILKQ